jgi:hypothetical protein
MRIEIPFERLTNFGRAEPTLRSREWISPDAEPKNVR